MKASEHTQEQIKNVILQAIGTFQPSGEAMPMTDILIHATPDTGEITVCDDDGNELARTVAEDLAENAEGDFYEELQPVLRRCIAALHTQLLNAPIMKPYDILLVNDDGETVANLYCVEDDTVVLDEEMIRKIDEDLDNFLEKLMEKP